MSDECKGKRENEEVAVTVSEEQDEVDNEAVMRIPEDLKLTVLHVLTYRTVDEQHAQADQCTTDPRPDTKQEQCLTGSVGIVEEVEEDVPRGATDNDFRNQLVETRGSDPRNNGQDRTNGACQTATIRGRFVRTEPHRKMVRSTGNRISEQLKSSNPPQAFANGANPDGCCAAGIAAMRPYQVFR